MTLCANRPDGGFGPYYTIGQTHVLTTCFIDTILLPIGPCLFILFSIIATILYWSSRSNAQDHATVLASTSDAKSRDAEIPLNSRSTATGPARSTWPKIRRAFLVLVTFFIIALIAMHALVIARLATNHQGIGLLPFQFVPLLLVLVSLYLPAPAWSRGGFKRPARPHGLTWMVGVGLWSAWMIIVEGIRIWSYSKVYNAIGEAAYDGINSQYLYSDKLIDAIVILCVYFVFFLCYSLLMSLECRQYGWRTFK